MQIDFKTSFCTNKIENKPIYLWQLLVLLLNNTEDYCHIIRWVSFDQGLFEIIDKNEVAKIWGKTKSNDQMNWNILSRSLR